MHAAQGEITLVDDLLESAGPMDTRAHFTDRGAGDRKWQSVNELR